VAVAASIAVAFVGAAEGMVADGMAPVGAAAAAALIGAAIAGRVHAGSVVATACVTVVGAWAVWAGRLIADAQGAADLERTELIRLRTEMVTTVSHELRTPLTVIQGATATLTRRWDVLTEPERLDLIDVLTENVASLDASILHFVDAARLERGGVVLSPEWVDVGAAIDAACARRNAALAGHEVRRELAVGVVWADRTALERMLEHLLMNAARFSSIGLPITVRTSGTAAEATISVMDKGQGIPPHLQSVIWEPLRRGDVGETGVSRGAGLGLPIVRELARLHGGDATLASVKGRGTSVTVTLPQPAGPVLQPVRGRAASRRRAG
jgi:two-component system sensor histidine kinase KdpD